MTAWTPRAAAHSHGNLRPLTPAPAGMARHARRLAMTRAFALLFAGGAASADAVVNTAYDNIGAA